MAQSNEGGWQDYRGKTEGVLIHVGSARHHALPVRELIDSNGRTVLEPNYETGTYGLIQCQEARTRLAALKARRRYFLFGTRYQGLVEEARGRFYIVGTMRLEKSLEVRKRHVHKWMEQKDTTPPTPAPECMEMDECYAYQSGEMNFYALEDCFELTEPLMKSWGYKGKITKQMKLTFSEDKVNLILEHFKGKTPRNAEFQAAVRELEEKAEAAEAEKAAKAATAEPSGW
jgi:hypothetical protein